MMIRWFSITSNAEKEISLNAILRTVFWVKRRLSGNIQAEVFII